MKTKIHDAAIVASEVRKYYSGRRAALDGFNLTVEPGTVHGLLGPNGAGKTTAMRILATLQHWDSGCVRVGGRDVASDPDGVRARIGVAGQHAAVDDVLTGRQNLQMFARLHHMRSRKAGQRAEALLERFDLLEAADRPVRVYSGGMRRRLDLAVSLIRSPDVLFLDEPTTGLDPRSRSDVWDAIGELANSGTTVLLSTQYLEEADLLCSRISLVDRGRVVVDGSPAELKSRVGGSRVEILVPEGRDLAATADHASDVLGVTPNIDPATRQVSLAMHGGVETLARLAGRLAKIGLQSEDLSLHRPDLDEVFLHLTEPKPGEGESL